MVSAEGLNQIAGTFGGVAGGVADFIGRSVRFLVTTENIIFVIIIIGIIMATIWLWTQEQKSFMSRIPRREL